MNCSTITNDAMISFQNDFSAIGMAILENGKVWCSNSIVRCIGAATGQNIWALLQVRYH